jgi:hypothetical protein
MSTSTSNKQRQRVARIFGHIDRTQGQANPDQERELLISQVLETLTATGELADREAVEAAVDDILEQERLDAARQNAPKWWKQVPGWAWPPIVVFGLILLFPVSRILVRVLEAIVRLI